VLIALPLLLLSYLIGSLSGSLLLGRLRGIDIRGAGSGSTGGTNAFRTQGAWFALGTVAFDVGKGVLAAWLARRFMPPGSAPAWIYGCAFAAAIGHVWPVFHGLRGGKGAATLLGGLALLWPQIILPALLVWVLSLMWSGYVGFSTMMAGMAVLISAITWGVEATRLAYAAGIAGFLVFTHRANLARLRRGTEPRFERVRVLGRLMDRST
jgi:glycerol-3-phosphate acyltransferase PlsY